MRLTFSYQPVKTRMVKNTRNLHQVWLKGYTEKFDNNEFPPVVMVPLLIVP